MLVERHDELELLRETFADSVDGRGRVVLITGGLASGKTELLHAVADHAVERGALLLSATATRAEQGLRMGVGWQLFRGAALPAEVMDRVSPLADSAHGLCALLLDLAQDRPVMVAVDDVQFVDDASLEVLRCLRYRMRSAKVLVALTEWERPNLARPASRAEITRQPHRRIAIGPLSADGVAELVARRLGDDAGLATRCHALAGGNPFLTHALIEDLGRRNARQTVGAAFRDAVLDCLHRWDPEFHRVAGAMAILGDLATPELVGELVTVRPQSVAQVVDALTAAGLVHDGRLRHAELVTTVLDSLAPADRSRSHSRAAELLYRRGADAGEIARHLAAVDSVPGQWAVRVLRHAAEQALVSDADRAVRYLELAIRTCDDERERVVLRAALVRAAWRVNPSAAAWHLTPLYGALRSGEVAWRDAVPVLRHLLWQGDLDGAARQLQAVHACAGPPVGRTAAELRLAGEWIYGRLCDRVPPEAHAWLTPVEPTDSADGSVTVNPWRRAASLNELWAGGAIGEAVGTAEHVLQACLGDALPEVGATALLALDHLGQQQRVAFWCDALVDEARRQNAVTTQAVLGCVRADIAWRRGDLANAQAHASDALGLLHTRSWGVLIGLPLSVLVLVNTAAGRYDTVAALLDRAVPQAMFDTQVGLRYLHASGHYHLARGRPLAAIEDFERCGAAMRDWGFDVPAVVPWRSDLAQAYLKLGLCKQAKALVTEQLGLPRTAVGARVRAISLRVLAACCVPAERGRLLREAVRLLRQCGDRLELTRTLTDLSRAYQDIGDTDNAQVVLSMADQIARGCHAAETPVAPPQTAAVQSAPAPAPAPAPAQAQVAPAQRTRRPMEGPTERTVSALSGAEQKVAALAATGHSNREIGRRLSITVSTVEQHLTRVYRKLKVSRRADLCTELSRHDNTERVVVPEGPRVLVSR